MTARFSLRKRARLALAMGILSLAGCGETDATATRFTPASTDNSTSTDDVPPPLRQVSQEQRLPVAAAAGATVTIVLQAVTDRPFQGEAVLTPAGTGSSLSTALQGGQSGTSYAGDVRMGNCGSPGARVASLVSITADSTGRGSSYSTVPQALTDLLGSPHAVTFGSGGTIETCGVLGAP